MLSHEKKLMIILFLVLAFMVLGVASVLRVLIAVRQSWPLAMGDAGMALLAVSAVFLVAYGALRFGALLERRWAGLPPA